VAGREKHTKRWLFWFRAWVWKDVLDLRKEIAPALRDFAADGDLVILTADEFDIDAIEDGDEVPPEQDVVQVVEVLERVKASGLLPKKGAIGCDPAGIGGIVDALAEIGLVEPQVVGVGQGWGLSSAVFTMERKLKHKTLAHGGQRLMNWCVGNARSERRGKNVYISKSAAGTAKIDPLVAGFNAAKLLEANPEAVGNGLDDWLSSLASQAQAA